MTFGGITSLTSNISASASAVSFANRQVNDISNTIANGTNASVKTNSVTYGIAQKAKGEIAAWGLAEKLNSKTLDALNVRSTFNEYSYNDALRVKELALTALSGGLSSSDLQILEDEYNTIAARQLDHMNTFTAFVERHPEADNNNPSEWFSYVFDKNGQESEVAFTSELMIHRYTEDIYDAGYDFSDDTADILSEIKLFMSEYRGGNNTLGSMTPFVALEAAQEFAAKMESVVSKAILNLTELDMEAESAKLAKAQAQEQRSISASAIANQQLQSYTQVLGNVQAQSARLSRFYG